MRLLVLYTLQGPVDANLLLDVFLQEARLGADEQHAALNAAGAHLQGVEGIPNGQLSPAPPVVAGSVNHIHTPACRGAM